MYPLILLTKIYCRKFKVSKVLYSWFYLFELQWSSGDDDFNQNQFDNADVSRHSKPQAQVKGNNDGWLKYDTKSSTIEK
jgi:hypothetical protein